jgi:multicomponent Na+:H+ antiporter subunit E
MSNAPVDEPGRRQWWRRLHLTSVLWGAAVWTTLWGDFSWANALAGAVLGAAVAVVFPLPPLPGGIRLRPVAMLRLLVSFVGEVVMASAQVIKVILSPGTRLRNSVVEVNLLSDSDLSTTIVAEMTSLVPGSLTVDVRRSDHTLYLHALDTPDEEAVRQVRQRAMRLEERVLAALGMDLPPPRTAAPPTMTGGPR